MLLIPHTLRELVKWLVYAAFQDLVGQHGLVCNLAKRSVWRRVSDDEPGKEATPDDSAQLRQPETCGKAGTQETSGLGTGGPPHAQPRRLTALRRRQLWAPARYPPSGAPGNTARSRRRHPRAALTSSHGGGIDAAAARRGRNESHTALAVPFNRPRREATP